MWFCPGGFTLSPMLRVVSLSQQDKFGSSLSLCLEKVRDWMDKSCLKLNGAKTELLLLGHSAPLDIDHLWPSCLGHPPVPKKQIKSLGVWLDSNLDFKIQARKVAANCYGRLRMIRKILPLLPFDARRILVQALILSRLDYANAVYLGVPQATIKVLQTVQNCAARLLMNIPKRSSARTALVLLHWLPIQERTRFKAMCIVFRSISGKGPPLFHSMVHLYHHNRTLRSNNKRLLVVPTIQRSRSGGRQFSYNAAKFRNQLPDYLHLKSSYLKFRKQLKTVLFP